MDRIEKLQKMIDEASNIVFFGGAGVSTESGVPDFRSTDGLYYQQFDYPPEQILSHSFFVQNPKYFFDFYRKKILCPDAQPNPAHIALARLEAAGKLSAVITQNIDGLHQLAGSRNVLELHGTVHKNHCTRCGKSFSLSYIQNTSDVPRCSCGGIIKPDVVLYEESLDSSVLEGSVRAIQRADMLIIGGTSLVVYPAAGLIDYFKGKYLVVINKSPTSQDSAADLVISDAIGTTLSKIQISEKEVL